MRFRTSAVFLILAAMAALFTAAARGQERMARPKWERYTVSSQKASVLLPKKPVVIWEVDWCRQVSSSSYWVYAEEAAYEFRIVTKAREKIPKECETKVKFGQTTFEKRLEELGLSAARPDIIAAGKSRKVVSGHTTRWIIDDLKNDRWFELSITHRANIKVDEDRFANSLDLTGKETGLVIGAGSDWIIGDEPGNTGLEIARSEKDVPEPEQVEKLIIIAKSRASYTDMARQAHIQGSVTLRVTFMANGAVGSVQPVSGLPYGLTEQAIFAARKIVFLPMKRNGKTINTALLVQYAFNILE